MKDKRNGQAIILLLLALSIFLLGAIGLAVNVGLFYMHRQLAQSAADAAAEAAVMSLFGETNTAFYSNAFGASAFTCTPGSDERTPCVYARGQGFGITANDTVFVDFPNPVPGVQLSTDDDPPAVGVTISRTVDAGFLRFIGGDFVTVRVRAIAAITDVIAPIPILVVHPTRQGAFFVGGTPTIAICGGPPKSIQVNSTHPEAVDRTGNTGSPYINLANANGGDPAPLCNGTGGDFGVFGGPAEVADAFGGCAPGSPPLTAGNGFCGGTEGRYGPANAPVADPLAEGVVDDPGPPGVAVLPEAIALNQYGCPHAAGCVLYSPGEYTTAISIQNEVAVFKPGLYYMYGVGFEVRANGQARMAEPCVVDTDTGCGLMVYIDHDDSNDKFFISSNAGQTNGVSYKFNNWSANYGDCYGTCLLGSKADGPYKGVLFMAARNNERFVEHELQGGGGFTLVGTIYLTGSTDRLKDSLKLNPTNYQALKFSGNSGSATAVFGQIIVDTLELQGTPSIVMTLDPDATLVIRQVALVR